MAHYYPLFCRALDTEGLSEEEKEVNRRIIATTNPVKVSRALEALRAIVRQIQEYSFTYGEWVRFRIDLYAEARSCGLLEVIRWDTPTIEDHTVMLDFDWDIIRACGFPAIMVVFLWLDRYNCKYYTFRSDDTPWNYIELP